MSALYNHPSQCEPFLPSDKALEPVRAKAYELLQLASQVTGRADPSVMQALSERLRSMNSYYTNKIEGQHTFPAELESAMKKQYYPDAEEFKENSKGSGLEKREFSNSREFNSNSKANSKGSGLERIQRGQVLRSYPL